jgi:arginase
MHSRREFGKLARAAAVLAALPASARRSSGGRTRVMIAAPCNLGLRPMRSGHIPGAWRAPEVLEAAGIVQALGAERAIRLSRPEYRADAPAGSRIRNGPELRRFSEHLGKTVAATMAAGAFPAVVGGDCSILLGCLAGARHNGPVGLVHVDGHSDFYHPGNFDSAARLGSAAGMDLALATGRGEPLLAVWNGSPLVEDRYVSQIGERDELEPDYDYRDIETTHIRRFPIRKVRTLGTARVVREVLAQVRGMTLPLWLHVDLDVLDKRVMPAVDSPGSPGFTFDELGALLRRLVRSGRIVGVDFAIYDPDLDPTGRHARNIVRLVQNVFAG